jgi:hypothetical protein
MTKTTTTSELKRLEKQLEHLKEERDRDVMKTSDAIKEMVAYIKETPEPFDGQVPNPYTQKPTQKGCCIIS